MNQEILEYYKKVDFSYWEYELQFLQEQKIKISHDSEDIELRYIHNVKIFSTYLHFAEIFCINLLVLAYNDLRWLFSDTITFESELNNILNNRIEKKRLLDYFLDNFVFGINDKMQISNFKSKREIYFGILSEFLNNRNEYKGFLNAFKHSFRVFSDDSDVYMSSGEGIRFTPSYESVITYFDFKNEKDKKLKNTGKYLIRKCKIGFSNEYLFIQLNFILNMLQNARKIVLSNGTTVSIETLNFENDDFIEIYRNNFGFFHFKEPLYVADKL